MRSLRWALCAVLVSPLALAAGRLSSKQDSIREQPAAASSPREVAVVLVPPHDPVPGGVGPLAAERPAQLAVARPAAPAAGVRGSHTTVTNELAVYRIGRAAKVTRVAVIRTTGTPKTPVHRAPPQTPRPAPAPPAPKPKPKPAPQPQPAPAPTPPAVPPPAVPPPAVPPPAVPAPPAPPAPPVVVTPTPPAPPPPASAPAEPAAASAGDGSTRPGNGWGDPNHEHTGPPGQAKKH